LGVIRAVVVGAGVVAAVARGRKRAEAVAKFEPNIGVSHCSGVRVMCVWSKGVTAPCLEFAFARKPWGDVSAVEQAVHVAASDANSARCHQGDLSGGGGSHGR
jgi:hypothetical protein